MADVVINVGAVSAITAGTGLTGGTITGTGTIAADFGTTAGTICQGNDARLTAPVAPLAHASTHTAAGSDPLTLSQSQITSLTTDLAAKVAGTRQVIAGTGLGGGGALSADVTLNVSYGTSGTTACVGNDARLSNDRTPSTHASSHGAAGSDAITIAQSQVTSLVSDLAAKALGATTMTAGTGLTGGGDLSANRSFAVAYGTTSTTATVGNDARLSFTAAGTGATARTLQNKLRDVISVKDFGAVGDGSTDDRAAIQLALTAAIGKTLYFPSGTYAMSTQNGSGYQLTASLTADIRIVGENVTIKCTSGPHVYMMMYLDSGGFDVEMEGITWDGNNLVLNQVRIDGSSSASPTTTVLINNCTFTQTYGIVAGAFGNFANFPLNIKSGCKFVSITNCKFTNHSRAASVPGGGTQACVIDEYLTYYTQAVNVDGCLFSNITNAETGTSAYNIDTDGLVIFGGLTLGASWIPASATVTNNTFVNCKGRSVKIQNDESIVANNVVKFSILPINGNFGGFIGMQGAAGTVRNNIFHYDVTSGGANPFSTDGTFGAVGGCAVIFYTNHLNERTKSINIVGNVIFNNVPEATGVLNSMAYATESNYQTGNYPAFVVIRENRVCSGAVQDFLTMDLRTYLYSSCLYATISDNSATKMSRSLIGASIGNYSASNNFITCTGNANGGATVPHMIDVGTPANLFEANIVAIGNINIGNQVSKQRASGTSFVPRLGIVAPTEENGSQFSIQSVVVANDAEYTFPRRTYSQNGGLRFISVSSFGGECNALFSGAGGTLTSIYTNATGAVIAATGAAGTTASKINIGQNGSGDINVRNKLGASYIVTLFSWG
jgi:hypothetical protein